MAVRRVQLADDDGEAVYTSAPDEHDDVHDALEVDAWLDAERDEEERQAREIEAVEERELADERRSRDLAPTSDVSQVETPERTLTPEQRRIRREWGGERRRPDAVGTADAAEHLGLAADGVASTRTYEDTSADEATRWLQENDPTRTADGIAAELAAAFENHQLTLADARTAFRLGNPDARQRALRATVREVIASAWTDDRNRTLLADALGCSRAALYRLMAK